MPRSVRASDPLTTRVSRQQRIVIDGVGMTRAVRRMAAHLPQVGMLSDDEVTAIVRNHIESKFPKLCGNCGRQYGSLADYLRRTTHLGHPVSLDDPATALPEQLVGAISYANCPCGSTLAISSSGLDVLTKFALLQWAGASAARRRISIGQLLSDLRQRIDDDALQSDGGGS